MATHFNPLRVRRTMGRDDWQAPTPFGPAGFRWLHRDGQASLIVSESPTTLDGTDQTEWIHASMTGPGRVPTYEELCLLKEGVWGPEKEAYHVFAPASRHVNIHPHALHLWGRADGRPVLPNFAPFGSI